MSRNARIEKVAVSAYRVPTDRPESDGTLEWDATTIVLVEVTAGGATGIGFTYADRATADVIEDHLAPAIHGLDALSIAHCWHDMVDAIRNLGRPGIASMAVAACDIALHDLKGKLLDVSVASLLGRVRDSVPVYGSGGFTSYSERELEKQLGGWTWDGIKAVKMKVGRDPENDEARVKIARRAVGDDIALFVDANGAYDREQALTFADRFGVFDVSWFEEPVSSNDLDGLRLIRNNAPSGMEITAGEYGYTAQYFLEMATAGAVDVLQADATRCAGFTGFMRADAIAQACELPLSSHTAPALHVHCDVAAERVRHLEWFHDHVRIESMLFDGAPVLRDGAVAPNESRPGLGLEFKNADAEEYRL